MVYLVLRKASVGRLELVPLVWEVPNTLTPGRFARASVRNTSAMTGFYEGICMAGPCPALGTLNARPGLLWADHYIHLRRTDGQGAAVASGKVGKRQNGAAEFIAWGDRLPIASIGPVVPLALARRLFFRPLHQAWSYNAGRASAFAYPQSLPT
jgi:hypothetical protein